MPPAVTSTFTTTHWVIDRVHRLGPRMRTNPHVPRTTSLADAHINPVQVPKLTNRRPARALHATHFARRENDHGPLAFFGAQPSNATGRANQLATLPRIHFNIVNFQP